MRASPVRKQPKRKSILVGNPGLATAEGLSRWTQHTPEEAAEFLRILKHWRRDRHRRCDKP